MAGHWKMPLIVWAFRRWKTLLECEQTKKRIQVVDVARYGARGAMAHVKYQLYMSLPSRSLYVQAENFHAKVLEEFCEEVLRLFKALRAKEATIEVWSCDQVAWRVGGQAQAMSQGAGAAVESQSSRETSLSISRTWDPPSSAQASSYSSALDAESWFFLDDSSASSPTLVYGLDLSLAKDRILKMKRARVHDGADIGTGRLSLRYSRSGRFEMFAKAPGFGAIGFENLKRKTLTFEMEYNTQVYRWNEADGKWE